MVERLGDSPESHGGYAHGGKFQNSISTDLRSGRAHQIGPRTQVVSVRCLDPAGHPRDTIKRKRPHRR
jgi:hypothetical protein